jgi:hypothetical protein
MKIYCESVFGSLEEVPSILAFREALWWKRIPTKKFMENAEIIMLF